MKNLFKMFLMLSLVFGVMSCNSDEFANDKTNNESKTSNPHSLSKEEVLALTNDFFKESDGNNVNLRSGEIENLDCAVTVINQTVKDNETAMMEDVPVYTIIYEKNGQPVGYAVTIGDDRIEDKVVAYNDNDGIGIFGGDDADFWKDRIAGYIYCKINGIDMTSEEDDTIETGKQTISLRSNSTMTANETRMTEMKTNWNHVGSPYNSYAPFRNGVRASVSPVAVAMGEIMTFYEWPRVGAYERYDNYGRLSTVQTSYPEENWKLTENSMYNYVIPTNTIAKDHISNLLAEIAYKLNTNFNSIESQVHPKNIAMVFRQMGYACGDSLRPINSLLWIRSNLEYDSKPVFLTGWNKEETKIRAYIACGIKTVNDRYAYIYIKNCNAGSGDGWYNPFLFIKESPAYEADHEYRYKCRYFIGVGPNQFVGSDENGNYYTYNGIPGSTELYRASNENPY